MNGGESNYRTALGARQFDCAQYLEAHQFKYKSPGSQPKIVYFRGGIRVMLKTTRFKTT